MGRPRGARRKKESEGAKPFQGAYRRGRVPPVPQPESRRLTGPAAPDLPDREPPGRWLHLVRADPGAAAVVRRGGREAGDRHGADRRTRSGAVYAAEARSGEPTAE